MRQATEHGLQLIYFGADASWEALQKTGFRRRNTHLLREFAVHSKVARLVVVVPTTRAHALGQRSFWRLLFGLSKREKVQDVFAFAFVPGQRWLRVVAKLNRALVGWFIRRALRASEAAQTVQWCYWPSGYKQARSAGLRWPIVFDADHNIVDDVNLDANARSEMESMLLDCGRHCSLVFSGSRSMLSWFEQRGFQQVARLRNGVDLTRSAIPEDGPKELVGIPKPRLLYLGVISPWIDYALFAELARRRPDWSFVVVGEPFKTNAFEKLGELSNIHFLGFRGPSSVSSLQAACDVGLCLYDSKHPSWLDGDSMKIYDYLAAGLPVVSTPYHPNLNKDFAGLLQVAATPTELESAIETVLRSPGADPEWDRARELFLQANTWERRATEALELVQRAILSTARS